MASQVRGTYHTAFYPGDCRRQIERFLASYEPPAPGARPLVCAVVPHAGWRFSGGVAARTLKTLADRSEARHVILLGAVHRAYLDLGAVYPRGEWQTPFGAVAVDGELASEVLAALGTLVEEGASVHDSEHSLEVQLPFIHEFFPGVPILPILVPPQAAPVELGSRLARAVRGLGAVVVATTDLTHYGEVYGFEPAGVGEEAHEWMRRNDRRIIDLAVRMEAEAIPEEARKNWNACGAGALAAAVSYAREMGARGGALLEHTDSHDVDEKRQPFRMAVGYAGIVF